jgi:6-phosphogluconolactonase
MKATARLASLIQMKKAFLLAILSLPMGAAGQNNFIYTNDGSVPNTVSAFRVNSDGSLRLIPGSPFLTGGNGVSTDVNPGKVTTTTREDASFVYAGNNSDATISAFRIVRATGQLIAVPDSPFASGTPIPLLNFSLAASPNGRFLFATDEVSTVVHVFAIHRDGALEETPSSPFDVGAFSEGLKVSPNGRFLVVGLSSINAVGVFVINRKGELKAAPGSPFPASGAVTDVDVTCSNDRVFASDAGLSVIDAYRMAENGGLTPIAGSPFASGGTSTINAFSLSPNDEHLFASNLFDDTVSSLAVNSNGSLQPVPGSPFEDNGFGGLGFLGGSATTRAGEFLYVAVVDEAAVVGWRIGPGGSLTPVPGNPFFTGQPGFDVLSLTTFPAAKCQGDDEDNDQEAREKEWKDGAERTPAAQ